MVSYRNPSCWSYKSTLQPIIWPTVFVGHPWMSMMQSSWCHQRICVKSQDFKWLIIYHLSHVVAAIQHEQEGEMSHMYSLDLFKYLSIGTKSGRDRILDRGFLDGCLLSNASDQWVSKNTFISVYNINVYLYTSWNCSWLIDTDQD